MGVINKAAAEAAGATLLPTLPAAALNHSDQNLPIDDSHGSRERAEEDKRL